MPSAMIQALPGFRDFYPADTAARRYVFEKWREVARRYGFVEVDGPTLESVELYKKKSGGELVGQLFNFVDKGEREVALRPEMTPTLARMVATRDRDFKKPIKWFSVASYFRYEKQQKGRLREFTQLNCDLIGEAGPAADAEMIALAIDLFRSFGLTENDFFIRVNDRNVWLDFLKGRGIAAERAPEFLQIIDKIERERPEVTAQKLAGFGVTREELDAFLARPAAELGGALGTLEADLQARGLIQFVTFDPRIVRGLAYYTGVVFEVFDRARESRALAGGGRYDELVGTISDGAVKHPALGFRRGRRDAARPVARLAAYRCRDGSRHESGRRTRCVRGRSPTRPSARRRSALVGQLRGAGRRVDFPLGPQKVGKQFQAAETLGATHAAVVGNEWPQIKWKTLATREESIVSADDLPAPQSSHSTTPR